MGLFDTAIAVVLDATLGLWLGKIVFFSFVGAPTTFQALSEEYAGTVVNAIFPKYYLLGVAYAATAVLAAVIHGQLAGYDLALGIVFLGAFVGGATDLYARQILIPRMEAASDDGFEDHHRRSVLLNLVALAGVAVALVAAQL